MIYEADHNDGQPKIHNKLSTFRDAFDNVLLLYPLLVLLQIKIFFFFFVYVPLYLEIGQSMSIMVNCLFRANSANTRGCFLVIWSWSCWFGKMRMKAESDNRCTFNKSAVMKSLSLLKQLVFLLIYQRLREIILMVNARLILES